MTVIAEPTSPACPRCGNVLPGDAPAGLCPRCLLSDGFGDLSEGDFRFRTGQPGPRFVPPTIDELASEFPHLHFLQLLGSGGMGAVYLANQVRLDRRVAVKILPPDLADDPAFAERFLREARALARLSHPNIVGVYDFGQTPGGLYYFLMEYIEGPTLRQVVANRTAEPKQALEIVRQVCDALQFAHDKGVVHRDIKPENILLDSQGRVKIADFGLAKLLGIAEPQPGSPAAGSLTHTHQAMGTPHYMAPEQIAGSRGVDHRADIYSLGVVFYELLTGELPVGRFAAPSKKVQIDVRLDDVVLRSLEAEPAQRYQKASDVKTDVDVISAGRPTAPPAAVMQFVSAGVERGVHSVSSWAARGETSQLAQAALLLVAACFALLLLAVVLRIALLPAAMAAIASTIVGWLAIQEIRRSGGQRSGLIAATSATIALPLLLIVVVLWALCLIPGLVVQENIFHNYNDGDAVALGTMFAIPVCLIVGFLFVRFVWSKATAGLPAAVIERELSVVPPGLQSFFSAIPTPFDRAREDQQASPCSIVGQPSAVYPQEPDMRHESRAAAVRPRTSFKAIFGAIWAAVATMIGLLIAGSMLIVTDVQRGPAPAAPILILIVPVALLFVAVVLPAPIVVTVLGWSAVSDIRNSAGRLKGLPLAVFDGLFFPLLLIDAVVVVALMGLTGLTAYQFDRMHTPQEHMFLVLVVGTILSIAACIAIDVMIARAVWRRVTATTPGPAKPEWSIADAPPRRNRRDLIAAVIAVLVAAGLFGIKGLRDSGFPWREKSATVVYPHPSPAVSGGSESVAWSGSFWRQGPNGPELLPEWSDMALGIPQTTREQIDAALQHVAAQYDRMLNAHTTAEFEGEAVVFRIEPFPEELDRLRNEFWTRVDPLLDVEQQKIMRYNFPLSIESQHAFSDNAADFLMTLGHGSETTIRLERSGLWYRVVANFPNRGFASALPELPRDLRRFQYEFERLRSLRRDGLAVDPRRLPLVAPLPAGARPAPTASPGMPGYGGDMMSGSMMSGDMSMGMPGYGGGMMSGGMMPGDMSMGMGMSPGMEGEMSMSGDAITGMGMEMGGMLPEVGTSEGEDLPLKTRLEWWGLEPTTVAAIVDAAHEAETAYSALLERHTIVRGEGASRTFEVAPFASDIDALERRFWERVDPVLTVDQQRGLRQNLLIGELPDSHEAIDGRRRPGLLPLGRHGGMQIEIQRVGLWYRWDLELKTAAGVAYDLQPQETPSLPAWLRHFQDRYDELVPR